MGRPYLVVVSGVMLLVATACGFGDDADPAPTSTPDNMFILVTATATGIPADVTGIYVVEEGDTLYGIAEEVGVPAPTIAAINGITDQNAIYAGQELLIPTHEADS